MELRPSTTPIDDPFFATLRRRHPDVDVVLLPPTGPPGADPESAGEDDVAAALIRVATQTRQLWLAVAPGADDQPDARYGFGADPASVRAVARVVARRDDGLDVLVRLRHELGSHGWELRRPRGAGVERLTGVLDDLDLTASYAEQSGTLILAVSSESMHVGADRARELTFPADPRMGEH
jgi:hypothetical protein